MYGYFLTFVLSIGISITLLLFFQPRWMFSIITKIIPGVVYFVKTDKPIVALTIDDSPDCMTTLKILDTLQTYKAQATFFIISDKVRENESIVSEIVALKNELGNHFTKDTPSINLSLQEFEADILEAHTVISKFSIPQWLRPASGWYNANMLEIAQKYRYTVALGSLFPFDTHIHSPWVVSQHILFNVRPGDIIILHDCGSRGKRTAETLEIILPALLKKGYSIVTLSELWQSQELD